MTMSILGLGAAPISTQIVQRDRHAEFMSALALLAGTIEKIALQVRHYQRTEVLEAEEYFAPGQKGSSAMPHKRNPIISERLCGQARIIRGNCWPPSRTSPSGTSATSATPAPSGSSSPTARSFSITC